MGASENYTSSAHVRNYQMLQGTDRIKRALRAFEKELGATFTGQITRQINQAGARAAARIVKARTPVGRTGNLKRSVKTVSRKSRGTTTAQTSYYSLVGFEYPVGAHSHLLESGTGERHHASGKSVGAIQATRFFSRALEIAKPAILAGQTKEMSKGFKKASAKMAKGFSRG